jgi:hypothetical protein
VGFRERIQRIYANATSSLNINGHRSQPIPRQGCPLSILLFVVGLNPLLNALEMKLTDINIGIRGTKTTVIAYADDVTIVLSKPEDIPVVRETMKTYEEASGATINIQKSKGSWNTSVEVMYIPYYKEIRVIGIHIQRNTHATAKQSCNMLT